MAIVGNPVIGGSEGDAAGLTDPVSYVANGASAATVGDEGGANPERCNNDGSTADVFTTATAPADTALICKIDLGAPVRIEAYRAVGVGQNHAGGVGQGCYSSTDNSTFVQFGTDNTINPGNTVITVTETPATPVTAQYWAWGATSNHDNTAVITEFELYADAGQLP